MDCSVYANPFEQFRPWKYKMQNKSLILLEIFRRMLNFLEQFIKLEEHEYFMNLKLIFDIWNVRADDRECALSRWCFASMKIMKEMSMIEKERKKRKEGRSTVSSAWRRLKKQVYYYYLLLQSIIIKINYLFGPNIVSRCSVLFTSKDYMMS